jgi:nitrite reductase/ring-hydroxylating ferredoxin subunit
MGRFVKVATTDEMADQPAKCVEVDGQKIAVFKTEGAFCAVSDTCAHRGGPLSEGDLEGAVVTCPWHGAKFDVRTGSVVGPPARTGVKSYPVKVTGTDIEVELET